MYEIQNGLSGILRNTLLRLCDLMGEKVENIRAVIGMCDEHFIWKKHFNFIRSRLPRTNIHTRFIFKTGKFCTTLLAVGEKCMIVNRYGGDCDAYLDRVITEGVFRWNVQVDYKGVGFPLYHIGIVPSSLISPPEEFVDLEGFGCCFAICSRPWGTKLYGAKFDDVPELANKVPEFDFFLEDGCSVSLEVDMYKRTMCLFVDEKRVPCTVTNVYSSLYFGMDGWQDASFTSLSLRRLPRPCLGVGVGTGPGACDDDDEVYECEDVSSTRREGDSVKYSVKVKKHRN